MASSQTLTEYLDGVAEPFRADPRLLHKLIRATGRKTIVAILLSAGKAAAERHAK